ncbi:MAG: hypothetical protein N3C61_01510 [Candidatus Micrarchaeota archaeon]|nr:hypothetical protein [Candidatus Micrarchaeota archaeon]
MKNEKDLVVERNDVKEILSFLEQPVQSEQLAKPVSTQDENLEEILEQLGLPPLPPQHVFFVLHTEEGRVVKSIVEWWKYYIRGYREFNIQFNVRNTPIDERAISYDTIREVTIIDEMVVEEFLSIELGWEMRGIRWEHIFERYYEEILDDETYDYSIGDVAGKLIKGESPYYPSFEQRGWEKKVIREIKRNLL